MKKMLFFIISGLLLFSFPALSKSFENPNADFSVSQPCYGSITQFTDESTVSSGEINLRHWDFGDGHETWSLTNPEHKYDQAGSYTVTLTITDELGNTDTETKTITIHEIPTINFEFSEDTIIEIGENVIINETNNYADYTWYFNSVEYATGIDSINVSQAGLVSVTATDQYGCKGTDSVNIVMISENNPISLTSNVITPNGDGINDYLIIKNANDKDIYPFPFSVVVYNIWGQIVYESSDYQNNWDARDVDPGTFYYVIKTANKKDKVGSINVLQ